MTNVSKRMAQVRAPIIGHVAKLADRHPGTITMGQGVARLGPPAEALDALKVAIDKESGLSGYCAGAGIADLNDRLVDKVRRDNEIELGGASIFVTAGSNMAFMGAIHSICDVDDEVILLSPYYFNHEMAIEIAGAKPVIVALDQNFQPDLPAIRAAITERTKAIVTVSPCNPTGVVASLEALTEVNKLCAANGLFHISDEAYEHFVYDNMSHFSPGSLAEASLHTVTTFSFSKSYGMAGWRIGYVIIPEALASGFAKFQDTNLICPPVLNQLVAIGALEVGKEWCQNNLAGYQNIRDIVMSKLAKLGDRCRLVTPNGAFYAFVEVDTAQRDIAMVETLIADYGVAVLPGSAFGVKHGCSLRLAYGALDEFKAVEATDRLVAGIEKMSVGR